MTRCTSLKLTLGTGMSAKRSHLAVSSGVARQLNFLSTIVVKSLMIFQYCRESRSNLTKSLGGNLTESTWAWYCCLENSSSCVTESSAICEGDGCIIVGILLFFGVGLAFFVDDVASVSPAQPYDAFAGVPVQTPCVIIYIGWRFTTHIVLRHDVQLVSIGTIISSFSHFL
ncbi:hypothetical protein GOODEAATRI_023415 [Goodea atripinnis]|uniref:Uncharacterized protein n=1 Tax=Goodea atripinnis TaxID=208336 RepID=A0ABV0NMN2_9TELE